MAPDDRPGRRRPPPRRPEQSAPATPAGEDEWPRQAPLRGRGLLAAAIVAVAVVVAVAAARGDLADLPWGAIIGILVLVGLIALARRRRPRP